MFQQIGFLLMEREPSPEIDDELFNEVYGKAYSGPGTSATNSVVPKVNDEKKPLTCDKSDDEDEAPDPNAVPTDFTSREAKVWEAKAKATERNWKKRKEEEMICKICGDPGHFTQVLFFLLKLQLHTRMTGACYIFILLAISLPMVYCSYGIEAADFVLSQHHMVLQCWGYLLALFLFIICDSQCIIKESLEIF